MNFDSIRPYNREELPEVFDRLLSNEQFNAVMRYVFPQIPADVFAAKLKACPDTLSFQKIFAYPFLQGLTDKASKGADMNSEAIDLTKRYTFVSNHRDIVLDSAFLAKLLIDNGCSTTCEIAIGDNLLSLPWVKDFVRVNKSFIVERDLPMREMLNASKRLSEYMHYAIKEKHENVWIAQREGRAKDSNDRTQESLLKMMSMGGEGSVIERLKQLHIVPLSISYEYDPCDYLKAWEMQRRRDNTDFKKEKDEDVHSMQTGIVGYKGYVHYECAPCMDDFLDNIPYGTPKPELYTIIATHIDKEIHKRYRLYPINYVALDKLRGTAAYTEYYTEEELQGVEKYFKVQLSKIEAENKDEAYLMQKMLEMYANPLINKQSVFKQNK